MKNLSKQFLGIHAGAAICLAAFAFPSHVFADTHLVIIESFKFNPETIEIKAGDIVVWENRDIAPHTATSSNHQWDTGEIKFGESVELRFDSPMAGEYFCAYHPHMRATLSIGTE